MRGHRGKTDYQGQVGPSGTDFPHLSPNAALTYDVYTPDGTTTGLTINGGTYSSAASDLTHPSLGSGLQYCESISSAALRSA